MSSGSSTGTGTSGTPSSTRTGGGRSSKPMDSGERTLQAVIDNTYVESACITQEQFLMGKVPLRKTRVKKVPRESYYYVDTSKPFKLRNLGCISKSPDEDWQLYTVMYAHGTYYERDVRSEKWLFTHVGKIGCWKPSFWSRSSTTTHAKCSLTRILAFTWFHAL